MIKHLSYLKRYRRYFPKFLMNCTGCSCIAIQECKNVDMEYHGNAKNLIPQSLSSWIDFMFQTELEMQSKLWSEACQILYECLFVKRSFKNWLSALYTSHKTVSNVHLLIMEVNIFHVKCYVRKSACCCCPIHSMIWNGM